MRDKKLPAEIVRVILLPFESLGRKQNHADSRGKKQNHADSRGRKQNHADSLGRKQNHADSLGRKPNMCLKVLTSTKAIFSYKSRTSLRRKQWVVGWCDGAG